MNPERPDIVFDCNILLQAMARANGPAAQALRLVEQNAVTLYISRPILQEFRRVTEYPEIRQKNPQITDLLIREFIEQLQWRAVYLRDVPHVFKYPRDPDDEPYLNLAGLVAADYLVSRDRDLLSLMTDHSEEAKQFRQLSPRTRILDPISFLAALAPTVPPT